MTAALLASSTDTLSNVPQTLSGGGRVLLPYVSFRDDPGGPTRIQRPKSRRAESCTVKCVTTCIRGGAGSPGEGPLNARSGDSAPADFSVIAY
ncbi:hypothetical protein QJS10_CPA05g02498 [Acorus calamus]|uniref:Uncharacterized protein n=1 Tax=Acorus calamus TaxID=4465 RepID=A0AAV9EVT0_ACOCL|nr:hypothetical protein QJS10_CPA05g02498 [Acorus calamus]